MEARKTGLPPFDAHALGISVIVAAEDLIDAVHMPLLRATFFESSTRQAYIDVNDEMKRAAVELIV